MADALMSKKKKILFPIGIALIAIVLVLAIIVFFSNSPVTPHFVATPIITPVYAIAELNASEGFTSSQVVAGPNISPLYTLAPGGTGIIPFTVYSKAQVPFNASLSVYLGETNVSSNGVQYSFSPSNFTVNPGENVTAVLTITVDKDAPSAFYWPTVEIQTNKEEYPYYIGGGANAAPALLIANSAPSCLYIVTLYDITPTSPRMITSSNVPAPTNASVTYPVATPIVSQVPEPFPEPTINLAPGESTTVVFACATQDALNLNATVPSEFTAEFSPTPLDIIYSNVSGNLYALTVTASPSLNPGNYGVNVEAILGPYPFKCSFQIAFQTSFPESDPA